MIVDLGLIDYKKAYEIQKAIVSARRSGKVEDSAILAEHNPVFTIGRTGSISNLLENEGSLAQRGIEVVTVDRGGDITFHGPGQLVIYPVLDLKKRGGDLHRYMRDLEEFVICFLKEYGVDGKRSAGRTGVWVEGEKIASIGIAASGWMTYHGLSLNINTDLKYFDMINPCGLKGVRMTSLGRLLGYNVSIEHAKKRITVHLEDFINACDAVLA